MLLLTGAALGDRFGRRRMFAIGLGIFTLASAAAALAPVDRGARRRARVQGVGGAIVTPLTLTILSAAVPAEKRGLALGAWGGIGGLAVALGPLVGGAVVSGLSWQWIFWLNVPIGLVADPARAAAPRRDATARRAGSTCPGLGLVERRPARDRLGPRPRRTARAGRAPRSSLSLAAGAVLVVAFVLWELRTETPMLPMRFFRNRTFALTNVASLLMFFGMFGSIFLLAQFFQTVQGYSPFGSGLRILPWTAMPIFVAPIAGALSDRIGGRPLMALGLALQAIGLGWIAAIASPTAAVRRLRRAVRHLGDRHGALLRAGRERRALVGAAARRRARRRAPTTRSASSAASSASRCSPRSSRTTAATAPARRSSTGSIPAIWVGAVVVAARRGRGARDPAAQAAAARSRPPARARRGVA